jgi:hypothetical protein
VVEVTGRQTNTKELATQLLHIIINSPTKTWSHKMMRCLTYIYSTPYMLQQQLHLKGFALAWLSIKHLLPLSIITPSQLNKYQWWFDRDVRIRSPRQAGRAMHLNPMGEETSRTLVYERDVAQRCVQQIRGV